MTIGVTLDTDPGQHHGDDACSRLSRRICLLELAIVGQDALAHGHAGCVRKGEQAGPYFSDESLAVATGDASSEARLSAVDREHTVESCSTRATPRFDAEVDCNNSIVANSQVENGQVQASDQGPSYGQPVEEKPAGEEAAPNENASSIQTFVSTNDAMDMITSQIERTIAMCESNFSTEREALYLQLQHAEDKVLKERQQALRQSALVSDLTRRVDRICAEVQDVDKKPERVPTQRNVTFASDDSVFRPDLSVARSQSVGLTGRAMASVRESLVAKGQSFQSLRHHRRPTSPSPDTPRPSPRLPRIASLTSPLRSPHRSPRRSPPWGSAQKRRAERVEVEVPVISTEAEARKLFRGRSPGRSSAQKRGDGSSGGKAREVEPDAHSLFHDSSAKSRRGSSFEFRSRVSASSIAASGGTETEGHTFDDDSSSCQSSINTPSSSLSSEVRTDDLNRSISGDSDGQFEDAF